MQLSSCCVSCPAPAQCITSISQVGSTSKPSAACGTARLPSAALLAICHCCSKPLAWAGVRLLSVAASMLAAPTRSAELTSASHCSGGGGSAKPRLCHCLRHRPTTPCMLSPCSPLPPAQLKAVLCSLVAPAQGLHCIGPQNAQAISQCCSQRGTKRPTRSQSAARTERRRRRFRSLGPRDAHISRSPAKGRMPAARALADQTGAAPKLRSLPSSGTLLPSLACLAAGPAAAARWRPGAAAGAAAGASAAAGWGSAAAMGWAASGCRAACVLLAGRCCLRSASSAGGQLVDNPSFSHQL